MTYDLKGVSDDANSHKLLAIVPTVHHKRIGQPLDDGTLCFAETLNSVPAGRMRDVDGRADLDVVAIEPQVIYQLGVTPQARRTQGRSLG